MHRNKKSRILVLFFLVCLFFGSVHAYAASSSKKAKVPTEKQMNSWANKIVNTATKRKIDNQRPHFPLRGNLILVYHSPDKSEGCHVYGKYDCKLSKDPHPNDPFFQPVSGKGVPKYDVPAYTWANTQKECDYLVVYGGFEESREKRYYQGGIDRVSIATRVYIIDPKKSRTVYCNTLAIDTPPPMTNHTTGKVDRLRAEAEVLYILTGKKSN